MFDAPLDFDAFAVRDPLLRSPAPLRDRRRRQGATATRTGRSAEEQALRRYLDAGWRLAARNWRADRLHGGGEIDLVLEGDDLFAFVEVKARRRLDAAARAVTSAQVRRIQNAACRWLDLQGRWGSNMRFDLAMRDRDGRMEIIENAFF